LFWSSCLSRLGVLSKCCCRGVGGWSNNGVKANESGPKLRIGVLSERVGVLFGLYWLDIGVLNELVEAEFMMWYKAAVLLVCSLT